MSTLFIVAIIIGVIAGVCVLLVSIDNKQKRTAMNDLLQRFSQLGSDHNLSFSSQEVLKDGVIGLDGMHRKLAVLQKRNEDGFHSNVIDLNDVKTCSVKRQYGTIGGSDLQTKKPEQFLEKIVLRFELANGGEPMEVMFYNHIDHVIYQIAELENKAKHWEAILSKMQAPVKKMA
ncbi:hypothetical protein [Flavisolibacter ginsenosidimutans]|uniref:Uncharacterized protein n=1 Tax=Flavisolibacter ginsenosidimutans TaxID=661481 RepID=A0A5B8UDA7_9BACT|nr:hypothetical protein [Flavisolibacter ginsenosidimutans]QEC54473.1 hypothetical protein FSB75_00690 [Flavisolibacter ginsenosidimutans]